MIWRPWDLKMPLVVIAVALCYLPYLSVGWGVFGFLTKGYLTEEGIGAGNDLWPLSLWRLVSGTFKVMLPPTLSWPRRPHVQEAFGRAPPRHTIASSLADTNMLLLVVSAVVAQLSLAFSAHHAVCRPLRSPANVGRFDRSALADQQLTGISTFQSWSSNLFYSEVFSGFWLPGGPI